jgi:5'-nucleotidase (lipoprotein e(P4) family)
MPVNPFLKSKAAPLLCLAGALLLSGCATRRTGVRPAAPPAPEAAPTKADENLHALLWVQTAVEYRALALQTYRRATRQLDAALADPTWTACIEQQGNVRGLPPAIVVDIDETVLDNAAAGARLILRHEEFSEGTSWAQWVKEAKAAPVPGAAEFAQYARSKGVTVFYLTNRRSALEAFTRRNLALCGFPLDEARDTVLTLDEKGWTSSDKAARRKAVAGSHRVLLIVGDDLGDFVPAKLPLAERKAIYERYAPFWGERWIVLPNPSYGSWEGATIGYQYALPRSEKLRLKVNLLDPK